MTAGRAAASVLVSALVALTAACGDAGSSTDAQDEPSATVSSSPEPTRSTSPSARPSPTATRSLPPLPACGTIWISRKTLPKHYRGCQRGDLRLERNAVECSSGQIFVTFGKRFYAVLGGPVNTISGLDDPQYVRARGTCLA